ncbi:MAG: hypothetical protein WC763_06715 [Candidatus Paceibacterota bacterium]
MLRLNSSRIDIATMDSERSEMAGEEATTATTTGAGDGAAAANSTHHHPLDDAYIQMIARCRHRAFSICVTERVGKQHAIAAAIEKCCHKGELYSPEVAIDLTDAILSAVAESHVLSSSSSSSSSSPPPPPSLLSSTASARVEFIVTDRLVVYVKDTLVHSDFAPAVVSFARTQAVKTLFERVAIMNPKLRLVEKHAAAQVCRRCRSGEFMGILRGQLASADEGMATKYTCNNPIHGEIQW